MKALKMRRVVAALSAATLVAAVFGSKCARAASASDESFQISTRNCELAAKYSAQYKGVSMLVMVDGKLIFEDYPNGSAPDKAYELASGTKSFAGVAALAAQDDHILSLDEKVSDTITEWKGDPQRDAITIRQLLSLTSGMKASVIRCPTYKESIHSPIISATGKSFQYGAEPFQVFGELMRRKLKNSRENMVDYLKRRVLDPIGVEIDKWRTGSDGMPLIPQGAMVTARNWAKFGEFVRLHGNYGGKQILSPQSIDQLFQPTAYNPMYGMTWWLIRPIDRKLRSTIRVLTMATDLNFGDPGVPADLVMAAGAGKQRLFISPGLKLIVVRQATGILQAMFNQDQTGYSDETFIRLLTTGHVPVSENKTNFLGGR